MAKRLPIDDAKARAALRVIEWAGRWQEFRLIDGRRLIVDGSHNEEGIRAVAPLLAALNAPTVIVGAVGVDRARPLVAAAAKAAGTRYRLAELNSVSNGGRTGVSDTFVSALWATDFLFSVAAHGADGVNFHCNLKPGSYSPISAVKGETRYTVHPLYYAMLLFHDAGQGRLLPTKVQSTANLVAHATLDDSGKVRVVLVNKDLTQEVVANVQVGARFRAGSVQRLTAPQASSKDGVTYANTMVAADGRWQRTLATEKAVAVHDGRATVSLPAASAMVLTITE